MIEWIDMFGLEEGESIRDLKETDEYLEYRWKYLIVFFGRKKPTGHGWYNVNLYGIWPRYLRRITRVLESMQENGIKIKK